MFQHPLFKCICGAPLNGAQNSPGERGDINPGDYTVCGYCGAVYRAELGEQGLRFAAVRDTKCPADVAALGAAARAGHLPPGVLMPPGRRKWS